MKCVRQTIIRNGVDFLVIGRNAEGNIVSREPMVTIESATCYAVANITSSGRVIFQACAAEALSGFVSTAAEESMNAPDVPQWNATYTSEWDDGITLTTKCVWDPIKKVVVDQERVELDGVDSLAREYVTYDDEEFEIEQELEDLEEG